MASDWSSKPGLLIKEAEKLAKDYAPVSGQGFELPLSAGVHVVTCLGTFNVLVNDKTKQSIHLWDVTIKGGGKQSILLPYEDRAKNTPGKEISIFVIAPPTGRKTVRFATASDGPEPSLNAAPKGVKAKATK